MPEKKQQANPQLPAWRIEVSEKVRARKAAQSLSNSATAEDVGTRDAGLGVESTAQEDRTSEYSSTNPTIQAALLRAKRANEKALRLAIPRIEPVRPLPQVVAFGSNRAATAKALEPPVPQEYREVEEKYEEVPYGKEAAADLNLPPSDCRKANHSGNNSSDVVFQQSQSHPLSPITPLENINEEEGKVRRLPIKCLDENCIIDYLEAELEKVERATIREQQSRLVGSKTQAFIFLIDFLAIAVSSLPFLLVAKFNNGNFVGSTSATLLIFFLISAFYLFSTQFLCSKTFGMMGTKTHIINAATCAPPSVFLVLLRTVGFYVSLLPAFLGFFWTAIDSRHRSWIDFISGTNVVQD